MSDILERLRSLDFSHVEARNAIRGTAVPRSMGRKAMRLCLIRGIRYHEYFLEQPEMEELRQLLPGISRALNARAIMSNTIPVMRAPEDKPYCIWHPHVAEEGTYRKLAERYPDMSYQVARACAVAHYTNLYQELDVLPDVSVAEEARANGADAIYDSIMKQPARYRIMDDYTRTVSRESPQVASLNGDTAVLSSLNIKQKFRIPTGEEDEPLSATILGDEVTAEDDLLFDDLDLLYPDLGFDENLFDITEDMNIDEVASEEVEDVGDLLACLTMPLPVDLPAGNKDVLILTAAYHGNVERYIRLRRPRMINGEAGCIVRGIYHNSLFATWWSHQTLPDTMYSGSISKAIHARVIMNNDLSRITDQGHIHPFSSNMPYMIWYPNTAARSTYRTLASRVPAMRPAVQHAAVFAQDKDLFDWLWADLRVPPDAYAFQEARRLDIDGTQSYFSRQLLVRAEELGIDLLAEVNSAVHSWRMYSVHNPTPSETWVPQKLTSNHVLSAMQDPGTYDGFTVDASTVDLFMSVPVEWRPSAEIQIELDYQEWPAKTYTID